MSCSESRLVARKSKLDSDQSITVGSEARNSSRNEKQKPWGTTSCWLILCRLTLYWVSYTVQVGTTSWKMVQPTEVWSLPELTIKTSRTAVLREAGTIWLIFHLRFLSPVPLQSVDRDAEPGHWGSDRSMRPLTSAAV